MKGLLQLSFLPQSTDFGLLILRLSLGLTMLFNHGWSKLANFGAASKQFPPLIATSEVTLALTVFAEVGCAGLLILGFFTRFAAAVLAIAMAVAFFSVHKMSLAMGPESGELAFVYMIGFLTLTFAGAGRFSADKA
jgi:putative oxidoreductase